MIPTLADRRPRLLFLILAHDRPEDAASLARVLTDAAPNARALIHFDASAADLAFAALEMAVADAPRIGLVRARVRCGWGTFGLVQAVLNSLTEIAAAGDPPDRVILLSGACLPCRPVSQLERYLAANSDREFIEAEDEGWILDGLREERHTLHFVLPPLRWPWADRLMVRIQRLLGVRRRFPAGLTPRFGSQWWALTWRTCRAVVDWAGENPNAMRFFRTTWIPDELVIQTIVHHVAPAGSVAGFSLTHVQFTDRGKPVVFFDDHVDLVPHLGRFFFRKAAPEARRLRERCLALAAGLDDGVPLEAIGARSEDYALTVRGRMRLATPGQIFARDQIPSSPEAVLARRNAPYLVIWGPDGLVRAVADALRGPEFERLGRIFAPGLVDFGPDRDGLAGLSSTDAAIRDAHPVLYLDRVRRRCARPPVICWSPFDAPALFSAVVSDPSALVVACIPQASTPKATRALLLAACAGPPPAPPSLDPFLAKAGWIDVLAQAAGGSDPLAGSSPERLILLPWATDGASRGARAARLKRSLEISTFAAEPWFGSLSARLEAVWAEFFAHGDREAV